MEFQKQQRILPFMIFTVLVVQLGVISGFANGEYFIRKSCKASLYPDLCYSSLSRFAHEVQQSPEKLAAVSISFCLSKVEPVKGYISGLSGKITDPKLSASIKQCVENFSDSIDRIKKSIKQMKNLKPPEAIKNVQTWMSAALTDEDTCVDAMKGVTDGPVKNDVINRTEEVKKFVSIALAMINLFAQG